MKHIKKVNEAGGAYKTEDDGKTWIDIGPENR